MHDEHIDLKQHGHSLHINQDSDGFAVWLNTEAGDYDGLCIGVGPTREMAVESAVTALEAAVEKLQAHGTETLS